MTRETALQIAMLALALALSAGAADAARGVVLTAAEDRVVVRLDGALFTEYVFGGTPRPYCYPVLGPGGVPLTRGFPMADVAGEEHDHPHHRSLWFAHGSVNGTDFWSEAPRSGRIVQDRVVELASGADVGILRTTDRWLNAAGDETCTDERTLRFYRGDAGRRQMDVEIVLLAGAAPVVLGDTKEGTMALRLNEQMRARLPGGTLGAGHIRNSAGLTQGAAWGRRAAWCACSGPVDGTVFTVAMLDHPENPRYPTWWHVREYGLFAANPFGQHDFEKAPPKAGDYTIPAGGRLRLRYRVLFLAGAATPEMLDAESAAWAAAIPGR